MFALLGHVIHHVDKCKKIPNALHRSGESDQSLIDRVMRKIITCNARCSLNMSAQFSYDVIHTPSDFNVILVIRLYVVLLKNITCP